MLPALEAARTDPARLPLVQLAIRKSAVSANHEWKRKLLLVSKTVSLLTDIGGPPKFRGRPRGTADKLCSLP
jgi:hypothetical protein